MATATYVENQSFVSKYLYLTACRFSADLKFSSKDGKVQENFQASLTSSSNSSPGKFSSRRVKPSRLRRRQPRQCNHTEKLNESSVFTQPVALDQLMPVIEPNSLNSLDDGAAEVCDHEPILTTSTSFQVDASVQTNST